MSYQGYGQPPYGQPPPQGYGQQQYPPPQGGHHPPPQPQQGHYPPPQHGHYPPPGGGGGYAPPQQQGGYYQPPPGAPPPGHYAPPQGPPPGQYPPSGGHYPPQHGGGHQPPYGQPPPPQQYGAPPPGQYNSPPPPQQYGHQPPPGQYGAPPPGQAPYGAPPAQPTAPTLGYGPPQQIQWDGGPDAQALRAAMKGFGTDEKALIKVLADKDPLQIQTLRSAFDRNFKRNLIEDLRKETSGYFEKGLVQLARGPLYADIHNLYEAMDGPGTKEVTLNDILLGRSNADMKAIKSAFKQTFGKSLEGMVKGDLSMKTERHFMLVLAANRAEDSSPVDQRQVEDDVQSLYKATEGRMGTDEILVCQILSARNNDQIRAIAHSYKQKFRKDLDDVIKSEFSGHMRDALHFQLREGVDKYMHAANLMEESMAGIGTKDHLLVARTVRFHWDKGYLANVKAAYQQRHRRSLRDRIKGETSGDYKALMIACIGD